MSDFDNNGFQGEWFITDKSNNEICIINFDTKTLKPINSPDEERLTKYQFNLFKALIENRGRLLSSEELYDSYKGQPNAHCQDAFVDYKKNLTDAVYNMKRKFPFLKECIENGKGYGTYFFNGDLYKKQDDTALPIIDNDNDFQNTQETVSSVSVATMEAVATREEDKKITPPINEDVDTEGTKKKNHRRLRKILIPVAAAVDVLLAGFLAFYFLGNSRGVENTAQRITYERDNTVRAMLSGAYKNMEIENGLTAYTDENDLESLLAEKGYGNSNYSRSYFYSGDELVFAEYAGDDLHQFYFENGKLVRWKYSEDILDSKSVTNHDKESTVAYSQWEEWVLDDSAKLVELWEFAELTGSSIKDFIFPDSNSRYINESELAGLSREEVRTAINELYARHGRRFYSQAWQSYFNSKSWYTAEIDLDDFSESIFNDYELENKKTLFKWETDHDWR